MGGGGSGSNVPLQCQDSGAGDFPLTEEDFRLQVAQLEDGCLVTQSRDLDRTWESVWRRPKGIHGAPSRLPLMQTWHYKNTEETHRKRSPWQG